jgi:hypothetical protein
MTGARNFVADLASAGKGYQEFKEMVNAAYGGQTLQKTASYAIIKKVKAGESTADMSHLNPKMTMRTPELITSVAAAIEEDCRLSLQTIAAARGISEKRFSTLPGSRPQKEVGQMGAQAAE